MGWLFVEGVPSISSCKFLWSYSISPENTPIFCVVGQIVAARLSAAGKEKGSQRFSVATAVGTKKYTPHKIHSLSSPQNLSILYSKSDYFLVWKDVRKLMI